jgi:hypothetical protein
MVAGLVATLLTASADAAVVICSTKKGKLSLRTDACKAKETLVPAADLGVTGPAGPQGDPGATGPSGVSGLEVVSELETIIQTGAVTTTVVASCPAGKRVVGGGGEFVPVVGTVLSWEVRESKPVTSEPQGWQYTVLANVNDDYGVRAWAICAAATP